ncbi:MAG: hypothetical protein E6G92_04100 [Alphaproteobacteria bacterium]|nr:MAG: hypothetical protein E6G92_04100 [Alphaproteobacteria bacterium]
MRHDLTLIAAIPHASACQCGRCMAEHRRQIREGKRDALLGLAVGAVISIVLIAIHFWPAIEATLGVRP